jgi:glyoxylate reductase
MTKRKAVVALSVSKESLIDGLKEWSVVFPQGKKFEDDDFLSEVKDADAIVSVFGHKLNTRMLDEARGVKMIANYGAGYDNVDVDYCSKHGILVTNCPDPVTEPTAELAFGLMLAVSRQIVDMNIRLRSGERLHWGVMRNLSSTLVGKKIGIVGMGAIGKAIARRAIASGMEVFYHNRNRLSQGDENQYNATLLPLDELLMQSDVVSLNVPLTAETKGLIGEREFKLMKKSAFLINTARGAVLKEDELIEALEKGEIAGAGLDVFVNEPKIPVKLFDMPNVVLMPHLGSATNEAREEMSRVVAFNIATAFSGEVPPNIVNSEVWEAWKDNLT